MADIVSVVNTILANGSTEYQARVPVATRTNIEAVGNPILTYAATMNEFLSALVNKIALQVVQNRTWSNPLALLKKGQKPLGGDIENSWTNPAEAEAYDKTASAAALLSTKTPDVKAEYFKLNRRGQYTATVYREQLRQAFTSWDNLGALIDSITNSLYSGDYIDEFILMKAAFSEAIKNQKMITAGITAVSDEATAKALVLAIKNASSAFEFPSTSWNAYSKAGGTGNAVTTWSPKDRQVLIIRADLLNYIGVHVLAAAFHMDEARFMGRVLAVDNFGDMDNVNAILADEGVLQVYDDLNEMTEFYNPKGLCTNFFWNHWQTYGVSVLANAVAFVDDSTAPNAPTITEPTDGDDSIDGTGEAGAIVFATQNGTYIGSAVVAVGGAWSIDATVATGDVFVVYQVDGGGNKSATATDTAVSGT